MTKIRLTTENMEKILRKNEGFTDVRSYVGAHSSTTNRYRIANGKLWVQSEGRDSVNGRFNDPEEECDRERTQRFLRSVLDQLDTDV